MTILLIEAHATTFVLRLLMMILYWEMITLWYTRRHRIQNVLSYRLRKIFFWYSRSKCRNAPTLLQGLLCPDYYFIDYLFLFVIKIPFTGFEILLDGWWYYAAISRGRWLHLKTSERYFSRRRASFPLATYYAMYYIYYFHIGRLLSMILWAKELISYTIIEMRCPPLSFSRSLIMYTRQQNTVATNKVQSSRHAKWFLLALSCPTLSHDTEAAAATSRCLLP